MKIKPCVLAATIFQQAIWIDFGGRPQVFNHQEYGDLIKTIVDK